MRKKVCYNEAIFIAYRVQEAVGFVDHEGG